MAVVIIGCKIALTFASLTPRVKIAPMLRRPFSCSLASPLLALIKRISESFSLASALKSAVAACSWRPSFDMILPIGHMIKVIKGTALNMIAAIFQSIKNKMIIEPTNWIKPVTKLGNCEVTSSLITEVSLTSRELLSPDLWSSK